MQKINELISKHLVEKNINPKNKKFNNIKEDNEFQI